MKKSLNILSWDSSNFFLKIKREQASLKIDFFSKTSINNTACLPKTFSILCEELPSVLKTTCFNQENLPFKKEVLSTEIGHLFEHMLLENIHLLYKKNKQKNLLVKGKTSWNWEIEKEGTFNIKITNIDQVENVVLIEALKNSIKLMEKIISFPKHKQLSVS